MSKQINNKYVNSSLKRTFDIVIVIIALPIIFLILLPILTIKFLEDLSFPLFLSTRIGLREKRFTIYKVRSMSPGNHLKQHPTANRNAPITRFGNLLRKSKLDEIPQIFNVLKGEMSIVGPRPNVPGQVYDGTYKNDDFLFFQIKPGLVDLSSLYYSDLNSIASRSDNPHQYYLMNIFPKKKLLVKYYLNYGDLKLDLIVITLLPISILFPKFGRKIIKKFIKL